MLLKAPDTSVHSSIPSNPSAVTSISGSQASGLLPAASITSDSKSANKGASTGIPLKELLELLEIPESLTRHYNTTLSFAWSKYKAHNAAEHLLNKIAAEGQWPSAYSNITQTQLVEVFVAKTSWHKSYKPVFSRVSSYQEMVDWLENADDCMEDSELWGEKKSNYTFVDLTNWLNAKDSRKKSKKKAVAVKVSTQKKATDKGAANKKR